MILNSFQNNGKHLSSCQTLKADIQWIKRHISEAIYIEILPFQLK